MPQKTIFKKIYREFINQEKELTGAVKASFHVFTNNVKKKGKETGKISLSMDGDIVIGDCHRQVNLDFSLYDFEKRDAKHLLKKLDKLQEAIDVAREGILAYTKAKEKLK